MNSSPSKEPVTGRTRTVVIAADRTIYWFSRHWLAIFNILVAIYVALPAAAPVLMKAGYTEPARTIYTAYSPMCHQMASRSFFLFGEQYAYPRPMAGTDLRPLDAYMGSLPEFSGIDPDNWLGYTIAARQFIGNEQLGYKMALCERDMAIYFFVLVGGLAYGFLRRRTEIPPLSFLMFAVLGLGPIGLDGFSQLFGYYTTPLDGSAPTGLAATIQQIFPLRESTPFLRVLTGGLFGFMLVWLSYPRIEQGMGDTSDQLETKLQRVDAQRADPVT